MASLAFPADRADIPHRIRNDEPRPFAARAQVILQLQYCINQAGNYEFGYRTAGQPAEADGAALAQALERADWHPYRERDDFTTSLDIAIPGCDTIVYVETFGPHFFWSLARDAVTTDEDLSDLYGDLLYLDGNRWVKREDFRGHFCRRIRFKARFNNVAATRTVRHKFSYNVLLRDRFGDMVEYEIDPDIQNPKV
jgi:hypothetical protein